MHSLAGLAAVCHECSAAQGEERQQQQQQQQQQQAAEGGQYRTYLLDLESSTTAVPVATYYY